jgi:hypothetical protein
LTRGVDAYWKSWSNETMRGDRIPIEAAFIWNVHRLSPLRYHSDLIQVGGELQRFPYSFKVPKPEWQRIIAANALLKRRHIMAESPEVQTIHPTFGFVKEHSQKQLEFLHQIDRPEFQDPLFLKKAIQRYRKFLMLAAMRRGSLTVPMYDIDLIWHSHMSMASEYHDFCMENFGHIIDHDFSDSSRDPGSRLHSAFEDTCDQWTRQFGEPYALECTKWRGETPESFWSTPQMRLAHQSVLQSAFVKSQQTIRKPWMFGKLGSPTFRTRLWTGAGSALFYDDLTFGKTDGEDDDEADGAVFLDEFDSDDESGSTWSKFWGLGSDDSTGGGSSVGSSCGASCGGGGCGG